MFKNKSKTGRNNICGEKIYISRKQHIPKMSQRILAEQLQIKGIDVDKNAFFLRCKKQAFGRVCRRLVLVPMTGVEPVRESLPTGF